MDLAFGWKKTLAYSLLPAVVLFAFLEGAARIAEVWMPPWKADFGWGFDENSRLYVPSNDAPGMMKLNPVKDVAFAEQRFQVPKPPGVFRIFVVGGSSVGRLTPHKEVWTSQITRALDGKYTFELICSGGSAYGSHRLTPIAAELMGYEPDMILFYEAHNEFEEIEQMKRADLATVPLQKVIYTSALCRFIRDRIAGVQLARNKKILANPAPDFFAALQYRYSAQEIEERMQAYRRNLTTIIELCKEHRVRLILGTVPSNLWRPDLFPDRNLEEEIRGLYDRGEYEQGLAMARSILAKHARHQSSDAENGIIRELAQAYKVPLADVETAVVEAEPHRVPGETLFDDRCHLNDAGNKILMRVFEEKIAEILSSVPAP